jgi:leucyl aminopeptidase (aminopeptidase T)
MDENSSRTHEPSLRELTAELDGLSKLFEEKVRANKELMDERDKRYTERDKDRQTEVDKALASADKQVAAAFAAAKESGIETKKAQDAYNLSHNDLLHKNEKLGTDMMPRSEANERFRSIDEKIGEIKSALSTGGGVLLGSKSIKDETRANIAIIISFLGLAFMLLLNWIKK